IVAGQILISWSTPQGSSVALEAYRVYVDGVLYLESTGLECVITDPIDQHTYVVQITALYADGVESLPVVLEILFTGLDEHLQKPITLHNHPNPFNPSTTISFSFKSGTGTIDIFNARGQLVRSWKGLSPAVRRIIWDGRDDDGKPLGSGIYLYRLRCPEGTRTRKMILAK
ncbi:MAG: T9SS type A sorting domain-containing protein, partial [Candidatus Cloacimonadaceae bacterium]|nr:T9SS type A sorting domain-containing protein [Candidatus Cloacimonadaceae bacterium]